MLNSDEQHTGQDYRYERKLRVQLVDRSWVYQLVCLHPLGFHPLFPDRIVNNLYFDTPDFSAYHQNISGANVRRKVRLRWYGDNRDELSQPVLEIKAKQSELGYKLRYPQEDMLWEHLPDWMNRHPLLSDHGLRPVLLNTYHRSYFGCCGGKFRLTLDAGIQYAAFRAGIPAYYSLQDESIVVELKYAAEHDDLACQLLNWFPFRQTKHSKYVSGINGLFY
jgi:hypothetical protein